MMPAAVFEVHLRNPGNNAANRHDRLFLSRSRSEGGGHESICAADVRRSTLKVPATVLVLGIEVGGRLASYAIAVGEATAEDDVSARRRARRRWGGLGEDRHGAARATRRIGPGASVGRRFFASGRQGEDRALRSGLVRSHLERRRLQLGHRRAETRTSARRGRSPTCTPGLPSAADTAPAGHQEPCLAAAARPGLAASRLHRFLAAGLAPRVVGQYPAPDHRRQPLGAGKAADSRLGEGKGRAVCDDRVPQGMPERREHPLFLLRQHAAGLLLPASGPFDAAGLQGLSGGGRGGAVHVRRLLRQCALLRSGHGQPGLPDHDERPLLRRSGGSLPAGPRLEGAGRGVLPVGEEGHGLHDGA